MSAAGSEAARQAARQLAGDIVVAAGAGTGKTHTLVDVFVHLVAGTSARGERVPPSRILALTFGEKAAAELRGRVRARFEQLARDPSSEPSLVGATNLPTAAEWRAFATSVSAAPISTFHAFAAALLRRHAASAGLDPGFLLLVDSVAIGLRRAAAEDAALAGLDNPTVHALVRELDFSLGEDARVKGLVEHIIDLSVRLDEEGRGALDLAGVCDDEREARADHAAGKAEFVAALADFEAACIAAVKSPPAGTRRLYLRAARPRLDAALAGMPPELDPELLPELVALYDALGINNYGGAEVKAARKRLDAAHDRMAQAHASLRSAQLASALLPVAAQAEATYREEKARRGALDFADLLRKTRDLLLADPAVRRESAGRFDAILVDEFQDTNPLQKQLLDLIRGPGVPRLVVGDPKQSIYEFRGADVTVFGDVAREVGVAGGQVLALTESRRGTVPLVDTVNLMFARAMRGGAHAFEIAFEPERDALAAIREGAPPAAHLLEADREHEPGEVAALVARVVREGWPVVDKDGTRRPAGWRDIAILMRRMTRLDEFLQALRRVGVPHYVVGGRGFHEAQEIRDLCHALVLVDEPDDALALLGVLRSPLAGISDVGLLALAELAPKRSHDRPGRLALHPLLKAGFVPPDALTDDERQRLQDFLAVYRRLREHADRLGVAGLLRTLTEATDLPAILAAAPHGEQRLANLELLLEQAAEHDASGGSRAAFVRTLRGLVNRERSLHEPAQVVGEADDVVRVMTVHRAKGLEFPVVFVPDVNARERDNVSQVAYDRLAGLGIRIRSATGDPVDSRRSAAVKELRTARARAESLRLFYVATTRARDHLVLAGGGGEDRIEKNSWRAVIDEFRAGEPRAAELLPLITNPAEAVAVVPTPAPAERDPAMLAGDAIAAAPAPVISRLTAPATPAARLVAPVTELADFDACPRRYRLRHEVGLAEHSPRPRVALPVVDAESPSEPLDPLERGTLAHRLLERLDLAELARRGEIVVDELLAEEGFAAPLDEAAADVRAAVLAFLAAPLGQSLLRRPPDSFLREESFVLVPPTDGPTQLLLKGQIDLVLFDGEGVTVIDYKLARPSSGRDYRFQLAAYAAAARALWNRPVRAALVYLLEPRPEARPLAFSDAELDATLAKLASLAVDLAEARRLTRFPGRERPTCEALGCGYVSRCHGDAPAAPPTSRKKSVSKSQLSLF